jgi:predicted DCC family thiol-disulfide oxidoreductase YuxK
VQDVLRADPRGIFRFAALQGDVGRAALARHGLDPAKLDTVCVLVNPNLQAGADPAHSQGERLLVRSRAVLYVWRRLGGMRALLATLAGMFPAYTLDKGYNFIARHRHQLLPQGSAQCWTPRPEYRERFID